MIYLACPYAHKDPAVMQHRYEKVTRKAGELMKLGHVVYSPITHNHPIATMIELPRTWEFWKEKDLPFICASDELWVYAIDGWKESVGVTAELEIARELCIPISYIT
jgi:hypothetical protein